MRRRTYPIANVRYVALKSGEHAIAIIRVVEGGYVLQWLNAHEYPMRFVRAEDVASIRGIVWVRTITASPEPPVSELVTRDTSRDVVAELTTDEFADLIRIAEDARRQPMPVRYLDANGLPDLSGPPPRSVTDSPFNRALLATKAYLRNRHKAAAFVQRWNAFATLVSESRMAEWVKPYEPTSHAGSDYDPSPEDKLIFKGVIEAAATVPLRTEESFDPETFFATVDAINKSGKYESDAWDNPRWVLSAPIFRCSGEHENAEGRSK